MANRSFKGYKGDKGEDIVVRYLVGKGYIILVEKYRSPFGEIDIIAQAGAYTIFVEVKYRRTPTFGHPREAVDWRKQENMRQTALHYIADHPDAVSDCRFDVIEIIGWDSMRIEHIENAF